ncbi:MAG: phosphoadenosine phosphosulfate reductase family protein, partial [Fusobacteriaceae bacterium]
MKPVFKEELEFLGIDLKYENYLWVDKRAYRAFDNEMNEIKFGRSIDRLPIVTDNLMTHKEYCEAYYSKFTSKKVDEEKMKFKKHIELSDYEEVVISVSGGKDSTVVADMVFDISKTNKKTRVLFGNTSNETHYTYKYVKDVYGDNLEIANPPEGFFPWVEKTGIIPNRFTRACCGIFKEGNIGKFLDDDKKTLQVFGIRKDESLARSSYEQVMINTKWNKKQKSNWKFYCPIVDFNDMDVWSYIIKNEIAFNNIYKFGYSRCGCTVCPFRSDYELKLNECFLPTYDKKWKTLIGKIFVRDGLAVNMNCTKDEFIDGAWKGGILRAEPTTEVIEDFAKNKGIDFEQAKKYFKKNRCTCGKRLSKDMIALNMKLLGRDTNGRMCLKCLGEFVGATKKELKNQIEGFKQT